VFDKWKRVKLQTLQEKYGGMAFGADMMVGVLEDMEKVRREEAKAKKSVAEIKKLKEESKALRKQFRKLRRKNKGRTRHVDPAVTAIPTTSGPYLHGGLWANFKELFKVGS
jgi:RecJ-like exonuclease